MKDNKIFVIILSFIVVILGLLLVYYFSSINGGFSFGKSGNSIFRKEHNNTNNTVVNNVINPGNNAGNVSAVNPKEKIPLGPVTDYNEFFNVNNIINKYYSYAVNHNYDSILEIFDSDYIMTNKIVKSNANKFVDVSSDEVSYYAKNMYRKGQGGVRYYFASGEMQKYDFTNEELNEVNNISFMVIIDYNSGTFSITPLASTDDIVNVAKEYDLPKSKVIKKSNVNVYEEQSYTDEIISVYYVSYFKNMLYLNSDKAYNMLSTQTKVKYPELKNFSDDLSNIYESIIPNLFSYGVSGSDGKRKYSLIMNNQKEIVFQESSIMNFTVVLP